jgi:hypothetical protein
MATTLDQMKIHGGQESGDGAEIMAKLKTANLRAAAA